MRICLFDIDGTLIASGGAGKAALEVALTAEHGVDEILPKLQLSGRTDPAIITDMLTMHGIEPTPQAMEALKATYLRHLPESLKTTTGAILPGISGILKELSKRSDVALGLLTGNVRAGASIKLKHFGIWDHFGFGGYGDHHLDRDDVAREAFSQVQQRYNGRVKRSDILVIGDTPMDVKCARAIGAKAIAVATGWHTVEELQGSEPDLLVKDLSNPAPLYGLWE